MYMKSFRIKPEQLLFLWKVGFGSAIAIWLAGSLGLLYSPSAGIITLLTIQNTRKETIAIAVRRILSFVLAVLLVYVVFSLMGYTFAAFGAFILFFVGFCYALGLKDGISMNAVLMTHFLIEKHMGLSLIGNEILLLMIGMGIGILLNMIMPRYRDRIRREQTRVEEEMKRILKGLAGRLKSKEACLIQAVSNNSTGTAETVFITTPVQKEVYKGEEIIAPVQKEADNRENTTVFEPENIDSTVDFKVLDTMLEELLIKAYEDAGNTLLSDTRYQVAYLEMRKLQVEVLKSIACHIEGIPVILRQSLPMADFLEHTAASFHELNNVIELLAELEKLSLHYKKEALPVTREEFEYRAILFQVLKDLEYFLLLKRNFVQELERKNMNSYWK